MAGLPGVTSLATYGGALQNYQGQAIVNPLTDRDAAAANQAYADTAAATHTVLRTWVRFTAAASTGAMVLVAYDAVWGTAPAVTPAIARSNTGIFTITHPATITDELGNTVTVNLRAGWGQSRSTVTPYDVYVVPTAANVLTVYVYNTAAAASDAVGVDIDVFGL